jgi:hypothetical protein
MIINNVEVQSQEHLEELIAELDESSKEGLRKLYQEEQQKSS